MNIKDQLIKHEGLKLKPYQDSVGKWTIGVGRNLDDNGISKDEAMIMLDNDIKSVLESVKQFDWFDKLSDIRKRVIIDMVFNLGITRFKKFKRTIACISIGDYVAASDEMLDSTWSKQVGIRAITLSNMMKFNKEM